MSTEGSPQKDSLAAWFWCRDSSSLQVKMILQKHLFITVGIVFCALFLLVGSVDLIAYQQHHEKISLVSGEQVFMSDGV